MAAIGRLAFREEGRILKAYYAPSPSTMDGAIFLGSIISIVAARPERKEAFIELMRESFGDVVEGKAGVRPTWSEAERAPEVERAGRA